MGILLDFIVDLALRSSFRQKQTKKTQKAGGFSSETFPKREETDRKPEIEIQQKFVGNRR